MKASSSGPLNPGWSGDRCPKQKMAWDVINDHRYFFLLLHGNSDTLCFIVSLMASVRVVFISFIIWAICKANVTFILSYLTIFLATNSLNFG